MLRTTISKLRQVYALTFVPRLLRGDLRLSPDRFERLSVNVQSSVDKSTNSSAQDKSETERCQRIVNRAFGSPTETADEDPTGKAGPLNIITPETPKPPETQYEKCQRIINKIFGEENAADRQPETGDPISIPITELHATTAKEHPETLAQKVERIDETPLVEAPPKPKIEGFNVPPKVLGGKKKRRIGERLSIVHYSSDKSTGRKKTSKKDGNLDELAKRCLDAPSSQIDERLLKEMEKLGVPPSSRRPRRSAHDSGIVQPEIMRRQRKPVAKTDMDFLMLRKARYRRRHSDLPPPFELTQTKPSSEIFRSSPGETVDNIYFRYERLPPLKEQILSDVIAMSEKAEVKSVHQVFDNAAACSVDRPPQQLFGQMAAAVMSNNTTSGPGNEFEQESLKKENKQKQGEEESFREYEKDIAGQKLDSTHVLSEAVDQQEITSRSPMMVKEEIDILKNLLRTRVEYLTPEMVKRLYPKDKLSTDTAPNFNREVVMGFTDSGLNDNMQNQGIDKLKIEKVKVNHAKVLDVQRNDVPVNPGVVIRECTDAQPGEQIEPTVLSSKQDTVSPHEMYEQIAIISKENEYDDNMNDQTNVTIDGDNVESSQGPTTNYPTQFMENVGMIAKGGSTPDDSTLLMSTGYDPNQPLIDPYDKSCHLYDEEDNEYQSLSPLNTPNKEETPGGGNEGPSDHNYQWTEGVKPHDLKEPVLAVDVDRLPDQDNQEIAHSNVYTTATQQAIDEAPDTAEDPVPRDTSNVPPDSREIAKEAALNPLINKGTVGHVVAETQPNIHSDTSAIPTDVSTVTIPKKLDPSKPIPLSELLRRIRERNRMDFCAQYEVRMACPEVEPVVGECGKKPPPCPPPAPICPPPPPKPCPPTKPPCPNPCKPKCPPPCNPAPCEPKSKCPPPKKNPCEKFTQCKCSTVQIQDALTLLLYLGPQFHVPQKALLPILACTVSSMSPSSNSEPVERMLSNLHELCSFILLASKKSASSDTSATDSSTHYAKTYDPWIPIPSWPIPVKEEKRKLVCPKEGCKVIPPNPNPPCRDVFPCRNFPKKHFSMIDSFILALGQHVTYDFADF